MDAKDLEMDEIKPSELFQALLIAVKAGRPCFTWGPPGIGKSQIHRQVADYLKMGFVDIRALLLDPVDLRGLPYFKDGKVYWAPPNFLPSEPNVLVFLDEANAAPQLTQASLYQLTLDGKVGEYELTEGSIVMMAGNRESDRAVTNRMPSALANRLTHLYLTVDTEDWIKWALQYGILPEVIAFVRWKPDLLYAFDPKKNEKAFPTPRTWEFASDLVKAAPQRHIEFDLLSGTVGKGAAAEFRGFLDIYRKLQDPQFVLMHPQTAKVYEDDPATMYAMCGALANLASEQTCKNLIAYANRLPDEYSVLLVQDASKKCEAICKTKDWISWASQHSDVLID